MLYMVPSKYVCVWFSKLAAIHVPYTFEYGLEYGRYIKWYCICMFDMNALSVLLVFLLTLMEWEKRLQRW